MSSIRCAFLERVTEVGVEGIVHAIVATGRQTVVETKRPGAVLSGDAQRGLNRVGIHNASDALDAARVGCNRILVAEGGDNGEVNHRSELPAVHVEVAREGNTQRELVDRHRVVVSTVLGVVHVDTAQADAGMRRHVERAELGEVLGAETEREDVGVKRFLVGAEDVVRRQVVGNLGVAQVSLDVEVAEGLCTVETEAVEVGIVVNL